MSMKALFARDILAETTAAGREPWTVERKLHTLLAAVAVLGWMLAYTALTRGIEAPQDTAREESAPTKVSVNLAPP